MTTQAVLLTIVPVQAGTRIETPNPLPINDQGTTGALGHATLGAEPNLNQKWQFVIPVQSAAGKQNMSYLLQLIALMLYPALGNANDQDVGATSGIGSDTIVSILNTAAP